MISVIVIDSRGFDHPDWLQLCLKSVENQILKPELIVINNRDRSKSIGQCWNEGVKQATGDWVFFLGDDDFISRDYIQVLNEYKQNRAVMVTTKMTVFSDATGEMTPYSNICSGMWQKKYLLENPFNEKLTSGVDREYLEEAVKKGNIYIVIPHHYGYFYRKHSDYSCAAKVTFVDQAKDIYILAASPVFVAPIADRLRKHHDIYLSIDKFDPLMAQKAKIIWCDWGDQEALKVSQFESTARKFLRIHAYEAFSSIINYIDFTKFEKVIFVAEHIKNYVDKKMKNAVVIPNGVDLKEFTLTKTQNNKIAWAGYISRKKGAQLLIYLANNLPEYEFHVAGKYQENDVCQYFNENKPDNLFLYPWQYDLNDWFKDKTYILNTSLRESQAMTVMQGMAAGLKPLVYNWVGAAQVYDKKWIWETEKDIRRLLDQTNAEEYREFIEKRYNFEILYPKIEALING